ncbi:hypothetical protein JCM19241_863 [Vibrio ishigakensis]|uniref:Uncharacterized protein n=1 Tax=Vibrio ishigakensis TaxID=1481914 RepID=A0A0B8Q4J1_9VIBR|nr:hypothetical protein JCM19241_863 [Vibrio ishigakensis]
MFGVLDHKLKKATKLHLIEYKQNNSYANSILNKVHGSTWDILDECLDSCRTIEEKALFSWLLVLEWERRYAMKTYDLLTADSIEGLQESHDNALHNAGLKGSLTNKIFDSTLKQLQKYRLNPFSTCFEPI